VWSAPKLPIAFFILSSRELNAAQATKSIAAPAKWSMRKRAFGMGYAEVFVPEL